MPYLLYTARGRPHSEHRRRNRVANLGVLSDLLTCALVATWRLRQDFLKGIPNSASNSCDISSLPPEITIVMSIPC